MVYESVLNEYIEEGSSMDMHELQLNLLHENINIQYQTFLGMTDLLMEVRLDSIHEGAVEKAKAVFEFIANLVKKFFKIISDAIKYILTIYGSLLSFLPGIGKYMLPIKDQKYHDMKDGSDVLKKLPSSLLGRINKYSAYSLNELEDMTGDLRAHAEAFSLEIVNTAIGSVGRVDAVKDIHTGMLIEIREYDVTSSGLILNDMKSRLNKYKKRCDNIDKLSKDLCKSINADLKKLSDMDFAKVPDGADYSAEQQRKDVCIIDLIRAEYAAMIQVCSKLYTTELNAIKICIKSAEEGAKHIKNLISKEGK